METQNKPTNQYIPYVIIILLTIAVIYLLINKGNSGLIDTSHYGKKVDSLNVEIKKQEVKTDSIMTILELEKTRVAQYEVELAKLKNKIDNERKQHEKDIARINSMSNSDIAREFTNAFE
jgi:hypothetical protein